MASSLEDIEIRSLRESELDEWFKHVASVFASTGEAYFRRHWFGDPHRDLEGIKVAVHRTEGIVATVRVFRRETVVQSPSGPVVVSTGGIGEVSTRESFRGRRLASILLQEAIAYMELHKVAISSLHTGSAAPLYSQLGWSSVGITTLRLTRQQLSEAASTASSSSSISEMNSIDSMRLVEQLQPIHDGYIRQFSGCFVRSREYWHTWWLAEAAIDRRVFIATDLSEARVTAYLVSSRAVHDDDPTRNISVLEFACEPQHGAQFVPLALAALEATGGESLKVALGMVESVLATSVVSAAAREEVHGLMYRAITSEAVLPTNDAHNHFFMRVDSF